MQSNPDPTFPMPSLFPYHTLHLKSPRNNRVSKHRRPSHLTQPLPLQIWNTFDRSLDNVGCRSPVEPSSSSLSVVFGIWKLRLTSLARMPRGATGRVQRHEMRGFRTRLWERAMGPYGLTRIWERGSRQG